MRTTCISLALAAALLVPGTAFAGGGPGVAPTPPVSADTSATPPTKASSTDQSSGTAPTSPPTKGSGSSGDPSGLPPAKTESAPPKAETSGGGTAAVTTAPVPAAAATPAPAVDTAPPMVAGGGGGPTAAPAHAMAPVRGSGQLPFTGAAQTIMLVLLAGMFIPLGVLVYCGARRGDRRLRLAMPRFAWAPTPDPVYVLHMPQETYVAPQVEITGPLVT